MKKLLKDLYSELVRSGQYMEAYCILLKLRRETIEVYPVNYGIMKSAFERSNKTLVERMEQAGYSIPVDGMRRYSIQ